MPNRRSQLALLKYLNFTVEVNRSTYATEFFSLKVWPHATARGLIDPRRSVPCMCGATSWQSHSTSAI